MPYLIRFILCLGIIGLFVESPCVLFAQDIPSSIETDPLAWLNAPLSCSQLSDQIKARYAPLGKFSELPDAKKEELRQVLEAVCSERFSHCNFKNCQREQAEIDPKNLPSDEELLAQATAQLRSLISDQERFRKLRIEEARKKGGQNTWGRISVPEDKRVKEDDQSSPERTSSTRDRGENSSRTHVDDEEDGSTDGGKEYREPPPLKH